MNLSYQDVTAFVNVCRDRGVEGPRIAEALRTLGFGEELIALALEEAGLIRRPTGRIPAVAPAPLQPPRAPSPADDPTRPIAEAPTLELSEGTRSLMTAALGTIPEIRLDLTSTYNAIRRANAETEKAETKRAAPRRSSPPTGTPAREAKIELAPLPSPRRAPAARRTSGRDYLEVAEQARASRRRRQRRVIEKARRYFWAALLVVLLGDAVHAVLPLLIRHQGRLWRIDLRVVSTPSPMEPARGPARSRPRAEPPAASLPVPDSVETP